MRKEEIFAELKKLNFPKDEYIIIGGASLVCQNVIEETSDIDLACSREFYDSLDWPMITGYFGNDIKVFTSFEIGVNFYDEKRITVIDGYRFADIIACYEVKKMEKRKENKKLLKKLECIIRERK